MSLRNSLLSILLILASMGGHAEPNYVLHDEPEVNGHPGYLSAWAVHGDLDKVVLIVPGFDTDNTDLPYDRLTGDFQPAVDLLGESGWDVVFYEYVDGSIDLKQNADSLARFIEYLDTQALPGYHLAVLGGSMGGMVTRTLLVQENDRLGIDSFVSIDSPHRGVSLSHWVDQDIVNLLLDYEAARQMAAGTEAYNEHYGWLESVEKQRAFKQQILNPIATCAVTLSDGSGGYWRVKPTDEAIHNRFYPVSSYVEYSGLRSTYMPYHSTALLISDATKKKVRNGRNFYRYKRNRSRYFDEIIANDRDEHGAPAYAVEQALEFILATGPRE